MTTPPPFDPPYITVYDTGDGLRAIETLADGTTQDITITAGGRPDTLHRQSLGAPTKGKSGPESTRKSTPNLGLVPSDRRAILFLDVPFSEKDDAKKLGAKWDAAMRKWYVPHGTDVNLFSRWWPEALKQEAKALGKL